MSRLDIAEERNEGEDERARDTEAGTIDRETEGGEETTNDVRLRRRTVRRQRSCDVGGKRPNKRRVRVATVRKGRVERM